MHPNLTASQEIPLVRTESTEFVGNQAQTSKKNLGSRISLISADEMQSLTDLTSEDHYRPSIYSSSDNLHKTSSNRSMFEPQSFASGLASRSMSVSNLSSSEFGAPSSSVARGHSPPPLSSEKNVDDDEQSDEDAEIDSFLQKMKSMRHATSMADVSRRQAAERQKINQQRLQLITGHIPQPLPKSSTVTVTDKDASTMRKTVFASICVALHHEDLNKRDKVNAEPNSDHAVSVEERDVMAGMTHTQSEEIITQVLNRMQPIINNTANYLVNSYRCGAENTIDARNEFRTKFIDGMRLRITHETMHAIKRADGPLKLETDEDVKNFCRLQNFQSKILDRDMKEEIRTMSVGTPITRRRIVPMFANSSKPEPLAENFLRECNLLPTDTAPNVDPTNRVSKPYKEEAPISNANNKPDHSSHSNKNNDVIDQPSQLNSEMKHKLAYGSLQDVSKELDTGDYQNPLDNGSFEQSTTKDTTTEPLAVNDQLANLDNVPMKIDNSEDQSGIKLVQFWHIVFPDRKALDEIEASRSHVEMKSKDNPLGITFIRRSQMDLTQLDDEEKRNLVGSINAACRPMFYEQSDKGDYTAVSSLKEPKFMTREIYEKSVLPMKVLNKAEQLRAEAPTFHRGQWWHGSPDDTNIPRITASRAFLDKATWGGWNLDTLHRRTSTPRFFCSSISEREKRDILNAQPRKIIFTKMGDPADLRQTTTDRAKQGEVNVAELSLHSAKRDYTDLISENAYRQQQHSSQTPELLNFSNTPITAKPANYRQRLIKPIVIKCVEYLETNKDNAEQFTFVQNAIVNLFGTLDKSMNIEQQDVVSLSKVITASWILYYLHKKQITSDLPKREMNRKLRNLRKKRFGLTVSPEIVDKLDLIGTYLEQVVGNSCSMDLSFLAALTPYHKRWLLEGMQYQELYNAAKRNEILLIPVFKALERSDLDKDAANLITIANEQQKSQPKESLNFTPKYLYILHEKVKDSPWGWQNRDNPTIHEIQLIFPFLTETAQFNDPCVLCGLYSTSESCRFSQFVLQQDSFQTKEHAKATGKKQWYAKDNRSTEQIYLNALFYNYPVVHTKEQRSEMQRAVDHTRKTIPTDKLVEMLKAAFNRAVKDPDINDAFEKTLQAVLLGYMNPFEAFHDLRDDSQSVYEYCRQHYNMEMFLNLDLFVLAEKFKSRHMTADDVKKVLITMKLLSNCSLLQSMTIAYALWIAADRYDRPTLYNTPQEAWDKFKVSARANIYLVFSKAYYWSTTLLHLYQSLEHVVKIMQGTFPNQHLARVVSTCRINEDTFQDYLNTLPNETVDDSDEESTVEVEVDNQVRNRWGSFAEAVKQTGKPSESVQFRKPIQTISRFNATRQTDV